ncbi:S41 family peptidase [Hymenobacter artigasi]|uniref:S41 family peptidase n=1 Tax=Hymenobacter artigasi TaxID=2719616 RepID=UPI0014484B53|nr:S41 family peptidase [Hymenobacter artigasi]
MAQSAPPQPCGCTQDFDYVVNYLERNLPAYAHDVTALTRPAYERLKRRLRRASARAKKESHCLPVLVAYVEFFHDQHTDISGATRPGVNDRDATAVQRFQTGAVFQQAETRRPRLARTYPLAAIEGRYQTVDSTYVVQIQPSRTRFRDYVGVIVTSRTPLWRTGQVKLELQRLPGESRYRVIQYNRNHSASCLGDVFQEQGYLRGTSWQKVGQPTSPPVAGPLAYRALTAKTAYLRLPSFDGGLRTQLDSVCQQVAARPPQNLIIDVRGNGGGADDAVVPLVPFLYTAPFQDDQREEYYVTPDNVARLTEYYRRMQHDSADYGADALQRVRTTLRWLHHVPAGQFRSDPTVPVKTFTGIVGRPERVVILYDRGCASTCETLLFWAKHSTKTTLAGENSGGFVGYGNVFSLPTPCWGLQLSTTTLRLPNQVAYEAVGVAPDVRLARDEDWLAQALRLLENP